MIFLARYSIYSIVVATRDAEEQTFLTVDNNLDPIRTYFYNSESLHFQPKE